MEKNASKAGQKTPPAMHSCVLHMPQMQNNPSGWCLCPQVERMEKKVSKAEQEAEAARAKRAELEKQAEELQGRWGGVGGP